MISMTRWVRWTGATVLTIGLLGSAWPQGLQPMVAAPAAPVATIDTTAAAVASPAVTPATTLLAQAAPSAADAPVGGVAAATAKTAPKFDGADTAWMLISTVLVLIMTIPGIILFYGGMLRTKNALSIVAHTLAAASVITLLWAMFGYSLAFSGGNPWIGDTARLYAHGLIGKAVGAHPSAPTIPESVFFLFQLSFAIITFALILGATAERMRLGVTVAFAALWSVLVYAPVAHWIWHPSGWLAKMGHMDFAGGTVVHIAAGVSALVLALMLGPRRDFKRGAVILPNNLVLTLTGTDPDRFARRRYSSDEYSPFGLDHHSCVGERLVRTTGRALAEVASGYSITKLADGPVELNANQHFGPSSALRLSVRPRT